MAIRVNHLTPNFFLKPIKIQIQPFPSTPLLKSNPKSKISCSSSGSISDAELASDLAMKMAKMKTHLMQREEAMKKSKELLFNEFCQYVGLKDDEVKQKWRKLDENEKWVLVKGFVSEWGFNFHPLSAKSVKAMMDEFLDEGVSYNASSSLFFPGLKKLMGFSQK